MTDYDHNDNDIEFNVEPHVSPGGSGAAIGGGSRPAFGGPPSSNPDPERDAAAARTFEEALNRYRTPPPARDHDQDVLSVAHQILGDDDNPSDHDIDAALAEAERLHPSEITFRAARRQYQQEGT